MAVQRVAELTLEELRVIIQEEIARSTASSLPPHYEDDLDDFPVDDLGIWPEGLTLRREQIYGDDF